MFTKTEHRTSSAKQILAALMLVSLLAVVFFGFATMSYGSDGKMEGNCPFSAMGAPPGQEGLGACRPAPILSEQAAFDRDTSPRHGAYHCVIAVGLRRFRI